MFYVVLGLLLLALAGMMGYVFIAGRKARAEEADGRVQSGRGTRSARDKHQKRAAKPREIPPSQELVSVEQVFPNGVFMVAGNRLAMAVSVHPLLNTVGAQPEMLAEQWIDWLRLLPEDTDLQIVNLPLPANLADLVDYWGELYRGWQEKVEEIGEDAPAGKQATFRADVCTDYLESFATTSATPQRGAFIVFSRDVPPAGAHALPHHIEQLVLDVSEWVNMAREQGLHMTTLLGADVVRLLWLAYYPPRYLMVPHQISERAISRMKGMAVEEAFLLSEEEVQRALDDSDYLRDLLAPDVFIEETDHVNLGGWRLYPYTMRDAKRLPNIADLIGRQGEFGDRLIASMHLRIPPQADVADVIARAATAQDALLQLARKAGRERVNYGALAQRQGKEEAIMVAETQQDRLLLVHWTGGVLVAEGEEAPRLLRAFEGNLRVAGVHDYLPAYLIAAQGFQSLLPGHRFSMTNTAPRNAFAANMAPWTPVSVTNYRDQGVPMSALDIPGETPVFPGKGRYPLLIHRGRGAPAGMSDAIVGAPGSGKSVFIKVSTARWLAQGHRVVIIDPKSEFIGFTREAAGTQLSVTAEHGFSPFLFPRFAKPPVQDVVDMIVQDNIAALLALYELAKGQPATGPERNVLIKAFRGAMEMLQMTKDVATWEGKDLTLHHVFQYLGQDLTHQYPEIVPLVMATLEQYASPRGEYYQRFNTPVTLDLSNDLTTLTLGMTGLQSDPVQRVMVTYFAIRAASLFSLQSFLGAEGEPPRTHIVVDEASNVMTTAAVVTAVVRMISLLPAFGISVHLAFQDFKALTNADALVSGQVGGGGVASLNTITGTVPAYFLLQQPPRSAQMAAEALGLGQREIEAIVKQPKGWFQLVLPAKDLVLSAYNAVPQTVQPFIQSDRKATQENFRQLRAER